MASDMAFKSGNRAHRALIALTRGRIGWRAGGMPVLRLTTSGRTSGVPRTVMLTTPHVDGDRVAIVASRGGDDRAPDWFRNIEANPEVLVAFEGRPETPMTARVTEADERAELWSVITQKQPRYGRYQAKTAREISVVLLEPTA